MSGASQKRKRADVEGEEGGYSDPRQSILTISMCKLRACPVRRRGEPSLRRSVLIFNTLKVVEHELRQEGVAFLSSEPIISLSVGDSEDIDLDVLPDHPCSPLHPHPPAVTNTDNSIHHVAKSSSIESCVSEPLLNNEAPTYTSLSSVSPYHPMEIDLSLGLNELTDTLARQTVSELITSAHLAVPFTGLTPSVLRFDEHRSDIDATFGDMDVLSAFPQNSKLPPLSAEEIVHSLAFGDNYSPLQTSQVCRSDVICDDFDSIMQIIVGM